MGISKIFNKDINSLSKIMNISKNSLSKLYGNTLSEQILEFAFTNSTWYPPQYIYWDSINSILWASQGFASSATMLKINPNTMTLISSGTFNTGGSNWGITNKSIRNNGYIYFGVPGNSCGRFNVDTLVSQGTSGFNTPNGTLNLGSDWWVAASSLFRRNPDTLANINTYGIDVYGGGILADGAYIYMIRSSGKYECYKINPSNGSIVATYTMPSTIVESVQGSCFTLDSNGFLWLVLNNGTISKVNTSNMSQVNNYSVSGCKGINIVGNYAYIVAGTKVLKYTISPNFSYVSEWNYGVNLVSIQNNGQYIFVVSDDGTNKKIIRKNMF